MVKIPISRDKSGRKAINSSDHGMFGDIKKPADLRGVKFGLKNSFNFKKFLLIAVPILMAVFVLVGSAKWYRSYQEDKKAESAPMPASTQRGEQDRGPDSEDVGKIIEETSTPEEVIEIEKVIIQETETGWLNVREGAGTSYEIMTKVYPDESYVLLEEVEEWYKIELPDDQTGWIFKEYAVKQ